MREGEVDQYVHYLDLRKKFDGGLANDRNFALLVGFVGGLTFGLLIGAMMVALWWSHMGA